MQCPKCEGTYVEVFGSFDGSQKIEFSGEDGLEVVDTNPTDFTWEDHDMVVCLDCGHEGTAIEFEAEDDPPAPHDACGDQGLVVDPIIERMMGPVGASIMQDDDRKRGLRAAVEAKLTCTGESPTDYSVREHVLLWEIIDSLIDECAEIRPADKPLTVEEICSRVAAHYTRKMNGPVDCTYMGEGWRWRNMEHHGSFEIHGRNLPSSPALQKQYPSGWEMLDRLSLEQALEIAQAKVRPELS